MTLKLSYFVRPVYRITSQVTLQNAGPSGSVFLGRVFKNAAQDSIKPRFLKTGLKERRASRVLYAGPQPIVQAAFFYHLSAFFLDWTQAPFHTRGLNPFFFGLVLLYSHSKKCEELSLIFSLTPDTSIFSLTLDLSVSVAVSVAVHRRSHPHPSPDAPSPI